MTPEAFYHSASIELHQINDASIAVRTFGDGPAVLFIHGYPVNGYTWRMLLPELSKHFRCIVIDLPGLGDSRWTNATDFTFTAQANRLVALLDALQQFSIVAHDTGATIARMVALAKPEAVSKLVLFNTEIPGHRPPYIPTYQKLAKLPGAALLCKYALTSPLFLSSNFGFGQFYTDKKLFRDPLYLAPYVERFRDSIRNIKGALQYQDGIEWNVIDSLRTRHREITADTLLLWGEHDKTFPVELGEKMSTQFGGKATFVRLPNASLMPHEEVPGEVLLRLVPFLRGL